MPCSASYLTLQVAAAVVDMVADVPVASVAGETPTIKLGNGQPYREGSLWKDIYQAILNAKHFVYIAGEHPILALSCTAILHTNHVSWVFPLCWPLAQFLRSIRL